MIEKSQLNQLRIVDSQSLVLNNSLVEQYDYRKVLIEHYQTERLKLISKEGDWDDKQLALERYKNQSFTYPAVSLGSEPNEIIFANRDNGYFSANNISGFDFISSYNVPTLKTIDEFIYGLTLPYFFFVYNNKLCLYGNISDNVVYAHSENKTLPLLTFCESYEYVSTDKPNQGFLNVGKLLLKSQYYKNMEVLFYSKESFAYLPDNYISYYSLYPKNPGEEVILQVKILNPKNLNLNEIKIDNNVVKLLSKEPYSYLEGKVYNKEDNFKQLYQERMYFKLIENGFSIHFIPNLVNKFTDYHFSLSLKKTDNSYADPVDINVDMSDVKEIKQTIQVEHQELYFNVPTSYKLSIDDNPNKQGTISQLTMSYWDVNNKIPYTSKTLSNGTLELTTELITIEDRKGEGISTIRFDAVETLKTLQSNWPGILKTKLKHGYTDSGLNKIPDDFIIVTHNFPSTYRYKENTNGSISFKPTYKGTLTLEDIELLSAVDITNDYFTTEDFTLKKSSNDSYLLTFNKIPSHPNGSTQSKLNIYFNYKCKRKDGGMVDWPSGLVNTTLTMEFVKDRWVIESMEVDNPLVGSSYLFFKIKDTLLNKYTGQYEQDERLRLNTLPKVEGAAKLVGKSLNWDPNTSRWNVDVDITGYGEIKLTYAEKYATSKVTVLKHTEPDHPLTLSPRQAVFHLNKTGRKIIDLTFDEPIKEIYTEFGIVALNSPIQIPNAYSAYLSPIYNPSKPGEIIAIGLDVTKDNLVESKAAFTVVKVNSRDFSNWTRKYEETVNIINDNVFNFTLQVTNFKYGETNTALLNLNNTSINNASINAKVYYLETGKAISTPNFKPIGEGIYQTNDLYIDSFLSTTSEFGLNIEVIDYDSGKKDDELPSISTYLSKIKFRTK